MIVDIMDWGKQEKSVDEANSETLAIDVETGFKN